jgi:hypothetical protein
LTQCPVIEGLPKTRPLIVPVMLTGIAGTGVGSRIGGHSRRGGGKLREQHRKHGIVAMTNEYRTSKTCVFCFEQVQLARATRETKGTWKRVRLNGAVECVNPDCVSFKCGYTTKGRDSHAALAIAIAGASNNAGTLPDKSSIGSTEAPRAGTSNVPTCL